MHGGDVHRIQSRDVHAFGCVPRGGYVRSGHRELLEPDGVRRDIVQRR
jgi:hypothetical protein